jgi:hypothetical protein
VDQHELAAVLDLQDEVPQVEVRPPMRKGPALWGSALAHLRTARDWDFGVRTINSKRLYPDGRLVDYKRGTITSQPALPVVKKVLPQVPDGARAGADRRSTHTVSLTSGVATTLGIRRVVGGGSAV